jgi:hypothetical protein
MVREIVFQAHIVIAIPREVNSLAAVGAGHAQREEQRVTSATNAVRQSGRHPHFDADVSFRT